MDWTKPKEQGVTDEGAQPPGTCASGEDGECGDYFTVPCSGMQEGAKKNWPKRFLGILLRPADVRGWAAWESNLLSVAASAQLSFLPH